MTAPHVGIEEFRSHFPALRHKSHFASCSQGALSDRVIASQQELQRIQLDFLNPWSRWSEAVEESRQRFATLIGASAGAIAVLSCASEAAFQVASGFAWEPGQTIVTCDLEFPSISHVWLAQRPAGVEVRFAELNEDGLATPDGYRDAIDAQTRLISIPLVSYRNGQRLPVREVIQSARRPQTRVLVDAYQALGVMPVDVNELGCDFLISGTLKYLLGLPGIAFLYVRPGVELDRDPSLTGWFGRRDPFSFEPRNLDYAPNASRFEVGSPPIPSAYAAAAGLSLIGELDIETVAGHLASLTTRLHTELVELGARLASPQSEEQRGPLVTIRVTDPDGLAAELEEQSIYTSPRGENLRLSCHYYTTDADVDRLLACLADLRVGNLGPVL